MQGLKTVGLLCVVFACLARAAEEPSAPAQYEFAYAVNDPTTGDQKDQQESRNGDDVIGYYRTLDADGFVRTVKYKSDAVNGFTAEVVREPVNGAAVPAPAVVKAVPKPVAVPAVAPVVAPAPVIVRAPAAPAVLPVAAPAIAPYYFGSSAGYPYNYQPYSYGYQGYQGYQGYPGYSGYQGYPGYQAYPYTPYSYGQYPFSAPYKYTAPVVRK
ncbi:Insect cuticle protein [Cinara cedri]|uniref:Insect cuticle protein n=1 Tax=Cinara cedri TaxID=506608 RepID=A0A5E4MWI4_9HEMI|nr:Insect cuticle protein [Cinara cedri]